jgi:PAP2 superfamily
VRAQATAADDVVSAPITPTGSGPVEAVLTPPRPAPARSSRWRRWWFGRVRPNPIGELLIIFALVKVYDRVRSWGAVRASTARSNGEGVLDAERWLRLDWEHTANHWLTGHAGFDLFAVYWYQFAHIGVTLAVLVWCYVRSPQRYRPMRNALIAINAVGMTVFFLLPVAPPRLLPDEVFTDSVADAGFGSTHGGPVPADQYAAMPSLHLAWATWTAVLAFSLLRGRRWRALCFGYPLVTSVAVVGTANHYVLDVLAGVATATTALWAAHTPAARRLADQMMRRWTSTVSASAPGSSGIQTVISRYPSTAAMARADGTPTVTSPASRVASSAPTPPGDGIRAESAETAR